MPRTTPESEEKTEAEASVEHFPFRDAEVLVGFEFLQKVVNTNVCDAVLSGRYGPYALLACRDRRGRTAVYSRWLAFPEISAAEGFLGDFLRFGLNNIERRTQEKLSVKEDQLRTGADAGRYNLGPLEHRARLNWAREYIQFSQQLEKLRDELLAIRKLRAVLADAQADVLSVG